MLCSSCGTEISENAYFCEKCGAPIRHSEGETPINSRKSQNTQIICSNCGTEFDSNFCPNCGLPKPTVILPKSEDGNETPAIAEKETAIAESSTDTQRIVYQGIPEPIKDDDKEKVRPGGYITAIKVVIGVFSVLLFLMYLADHVGLSMLLSVLSILLLTPLVSVLTRRKQFMIPAVLPLILSVVLGIIALLFYASPASDNDYRAQKRIAHIENEIKEGKYTSADSDIKKEKLSKSEETRLYALNYSSQGDYDSAAYALCEYCRTIDPLESATEDPRYNELLTISQEQSLKELTKKTIVLLEHDVNVAKIGVNGHDWQDATCTVPRTCSICGETDGEALGHDWIEATCTEPKICSRCKETDGEPLGHQFDEWEIVVEATCSEEGLKKADCLRCSQTIEEVIEKSPHTPGDWKITREAVKASETGEKERVCTVCGEVVETQTYVITKEEEKKRFIEGCEAVSYTNLSRYPDKYKGVKIKVTVTITDELEDKFLILYTPYSASMNGKEIAISDGREKKEPRLLKGDTVTIYGYGDGMERIKVKERRLLFDKTVDTYEIPMVKMLYTSLD